MSEILQATLRMPPDHWFGGEIELLQRYKMCVAAANYIDDLESQNAELYEALRQAAEWLPYHEPNHPDYEGEISDVGRRARDVLAKARGDGDE